MSRRRRTDPCVRGLQWDPLMAQVVHFRIRTALHGKLDPQVAGYADLLPCEITPHRTQARQPAPPPGAPRRRQPTSRCERHSPTLSLVPTAHSHITRWYERHTRTDLAGESAARLPSPRRAGRMRADSRAPVAGTPIIPSCGVTSTLYGSWRDVRDLADVRDLSDAPRASRLRGHGPRR